jgi:hypothetical protein
MKDGSYTLSVDGKIKYSLHGTECVPSGTPQNIPAGTVLPPPDPTKVCGAGFVAQSVLRPYPNMFIVFATEDTNAQSIIGYVLIPISCVILCFGTIGALMFSWDCCPSCGGRSSRGYSSPSRAMSATTSSDNPMLAMSTPSIIQYPFPQFAPPHSIQRDGDHRSLRTVAHGMHMIDLTDNDVSTLMGSEGHAPSLQGLILRNNDLGTLGGVHALVQLVALDVSSNNLHNLAGLGNVMNLAYLKVYDNDLTDLSGADMVASLKYLCVGNNEMRSLNGIEAFPGVTHVDFSSNEIASIAGLPGCAGLVGIDLSQNALTDACVPDLKALANLPGLQVLDIKGNDLSAIARQDVRDHFMSVKPGCQLHS